MKALAPQAIALAAQTMRRGYVVCFPTEGSYGLGADIRSAEGLGRLLALKGDRTDPIALIAADRAQARSVADAWPARAEHLAERHWPGPLTIVVQARPGLPAALTGGGDTIGVRVSSCDSARALAATLGAPVTATSANPGGFVPARSIAAAQTYFGDDVEVYLDAGEASIRPPSTVVRVYEDNTFEVLRKGAVEITHG